MLAQVAAVEEEWRLREVERVLASPPPWAETGGEFKKPRELEPLREDEVLTEADYDRVLGYRPDGEEITLRKALPEWEASLERIRLGGGLSVEQVRERLRR